MSDAKRAWMPDYLRLIALFGVVIVNVQFMGFSLFFGFPEIIGDTLADQITLWLVNGLALLKTYGLFSFMFGVGLGFLMRSAARRGLSFGRIYRNRMIGLLVLGILHGCLFFPGDILALYAVAGSILYLMRNLAPARLTRIGAVLLIMQVLIAAPVFLAGQGDVPADLLALERQALSEGSFADAAVFRSVAFGVIFALLIIFQGIAALGWFCLGLAAVKSGMIDNAAHPLWALARRFCLIPGIGLSLAGVSLVHTGTAAGGAIVTAAAAPIATLGYLGLIAWLARAPGQMMTGVLRAGGSSLSIYLGQSIILSMLFSGYGLGLWSNVSYLTATLLAIGVTICLIVALTLWRMVFANGPFEWILRRITYAGQAR